MYSKLKTYIEKNLSDNRFEHLISSAKVCSYICSMFGLDAGAGKIAGISHDIARELSDSEIISLAGKDGLGISNYELEHPVLLHGRAGAVMLEEKFGITNLEILDAVRWHTTGHPGMGEIGKALFVSDYIEPGRTHVSDAYRKKIYGMNLNGMVIEVLSSQIEYLRNSGNIIVESSILLYDKLLSENGKKHIGVG